MVLVTSTMSNLEGICGKKVKKIIVDELESRVNITFTDGAILEIWGDCGMDIVYNSKKED